MSVPFGKANFKHATKNTQHLVRAPQPPSHFLHNNISVSWRLQLITYKSRENRGSHGSVCEDRCFLGSEALLWRWKQHVPLILFAISNTLYILTLSSSSSLVWEERELRPMYRYLLRQIGQVYALRFGPSPCCTCWHTYSWAHSIPYRPCTYFMAYI
jgi:hypothetical protein